MLSKINNQKLKRTQKQKIEGKLNKFKSLTYGNYGIKVLNTGWVHPKQIEAMRKIISKKMREYGREYKGKFWIKTFPHFPITAKASGIRMGRGKGSFKTWAVKIKAGQILLEWYHPNLSLRDCYHIVHILSYKTNLKIKLIDFKSNFFKSL